MAAGGRDLVRETWAMAMEMNMEGSDPRNSSRYTGVLSVYPWHGQESIVGRVAPEESRNGPGAGAWKAGGSPHLKREEQNKQGTFRVVRGYHRP